MPYTSMRKTLLTLAACLVSALTLAHENRISETVTDTVPAQARVQTMLALSLKSSYISRGSQCGGVGLYPELGISYRGFSLEAWAFIGFDNKDTKELDLKLAYQTGGFSAGVTDYWYLPYEKSEQIGFFHFNPHHTQHQLEANVGYDLGFVRARWRTMFAGFDHLESGRRAYSTYVAIHAPFRLGGLTWEGTVGLTPWKGGYADRFNVVHLALQATKEIRFTPTFSLPVFAALTLNPDKQRVYFSAGFTL